MWDAGRYNIEHGGGEDRAGGRIFCFVTLPGISPPPLISSPSLSPLTHPSPHPHPDRHPTTNTDPVPHPPYWRAAYTGSGAERQPGPAPPPTGPWVTGRTSAPRRRGTEPCRGCRSTEPCPRPSATGSSVRRESCVGLVEGIERWGGKVGTNKNEPSGSRSRGTNISSKNVVRTGGRVSGRENRGERGAYCGCRDLWRC